MKAKKLARVFLLCILIASIHLNPDSETLILAEPPKSFECNKEILRSYMLHGRKQSTSDKMLLCPDITTNCCTKMDMQQIYHFVNDILPPRYNEYQSKVKMALSKLKRLHEHILKAVSRALERTPWRDSTQTQDWCARTVPFPHAYPHIYSTT